MESDKRRAWKSTNTEGAGSAVLSDDNLVLHVLLQLAKLKSGCRPFECCAEVCKVWRDATAAADERIAAWCERSWVVGDISKMAQTRRESSEVAAGTYVDVHLGGLPGAYDWEVRFFPRLGVLAAPDADHDEVHTQQVVAVQLRIPSVATPLQRMQLCPQIMDLLTAARRVFDQHPAEAEARLSRLFEELGRSNREYAELIVNHRHEFMSIVDGSAPPAPDRAFLGEGWSRRAEWQLTLHHPTDARRDQTKYLRLLFDSQQTMWPPNEDLWGVHRQPQNALFSFGLASSLAVEGFVLGDRMRLSLRIRVHPGRQRCVRDPASTTPWEVAGGGVHGLLPAGALSELLRQSRRSDYCSVFWCDLCQATKPVRSLLRCSRGCNFDVCTECFSLRSHRLVDHMTLGWAGRERALRDGFFSD